MARVVASLDPILWRGGKITEPGVYAGLPIGVYHSQCTDGPSISSSGLRTIINDSPAHYWYRSDLNPERAEEDGVEAEELVLGRAAHHLYLGEDDFSSEFVVRPDRWDSWREKAAKQWRAEKIAEGKTVLIPSQLYQLRGMAKSLAAHPLIKAGILDGLVETSFLWRDRDVPIWLKARPDVIPTSGVDFCDLKTAYSLQTDDLMRTIGQKGYHQQAALIAEGAERCAGLRMETFTLIFVEKTPPFCVRVVMLKDYMIALGHRLNQGGKRIFASCLRAKEWPGPGGADAESIDLPSWLHNRQEAAADLMESGSDAFD